MECAACSFENAPGIRFCGQCGRLLDVAREPRSYTPKHLAERILTSRSALEGERKQVTVLFADVKGSMELAEQVDVEEWHRILDRFFVILAAGVHRFEGTINQFTGDGIMALFGAPIALEDHARRACSAALHLLDELRRYAEELKRTQSLSFSVRMGLHSGEVVVGRIGDDLRMDYTAQGPVVGLAARLEQLADPGKAYVSERTAALVAEFLRLRDLGQFHLKGAREPVRVYELEGAWPHRTRLDVARGRGFSRFVGRAREMDVLEDALARTLAGDGQVVAVVADAGLGKSRLCHEFTERCRGRGFAVHLAHATALGKAVPFLPILAMLRAYFGVADQDGARAARDKIAGRLVLLDETLTAALPIVFEFLAVPDPDRPAPEMAPEARQRQLVEVLRRIVRHDRSREPQVFLLEDLHWLDGPSAAFLTSLAEAVAGSSSMLLVNFRPEYRPEWIEGPGARELALSPLGDEALDSLLTDLLGTDPSVEALGHLVRGRTAGNPFFIEEVVHALAEAGILAGSKGSHRLVKPVSEVAIPASVQVVIAARIDRLPEAAKLVLQTAAVIGKEFAAPILWRVVELPEAAQAEALTALGAAELVYEESLYPESVYAFKHPLIQEVAYRSQLGEPRRRIHAAVASALEEIDPTKLDERAALLAHHREAAGELLEAARWTRRASRWARSRNLAEALDHWRKVRALLERVGDSEETAALAQEARAAILGLGWAVGIDDEEASTLFEEGRSVATRSGDLRSLAILVTQYAWVKAGHREVEEYLRLSREAVEIAARTKDAALEAAVWAPLVRAHLFAGRLREALELAEQALGHMPEDPRFATLLGYSPSLNLGLLRANLLAFAARWHEAIRTFETVTSVCRDHGQSAMLAAVHIDHAWWTALLGEPRKAIELALRGLEIADRMGSQMTRVLAHQALGFARSQASAWDEAVEVLHQASSIARETHTGREARVLTLAHLAEAHLGRGDPDLARATAEEAVTEACRQGEKTWECYARLAHARVLTTSDGLARAAEIEAALDHASALVEETGAKCCDPFIRRQRAELARLRGDVAGRERGLREAERLFLEMGAPLRAAEVARELGS